MSDGSVVVYPCVDPILFSPHYVTPPCMVKVWAVDVSADRQCFALYHPTRTDFTLNVRPVVGSRSGLLSVGAACATGFV
jgi:hypothetical protein